MFLFAVVCLGTLTWAEIAPRQVPARLSIHLIAAPTPDRPTRFLVKATDTQGMAIDQVQLASQAWMTTMPMATDTITLTPEGQGISLIQMNLDMAGPWMIVISMHAHGFAPVQQSMVVQVLSLSGQSPFLFEGLSLPSP